MLTLTLLTLNKSVNSTRKKRLRTSGLGNIKYIIGQIDAHSCADYNKEYYRVVHLSYLKHSVQVIPISPINKRSSQMLKILLLNIDWKATSNYNMRNI